jgi:hypothetical protein
MTAEHAASVSLNRLAVAATNHCLTGCAIGEVLGLVISLATGWGNLTAIVLAIALAFVFGYSLTMIPLLRAGLAFGQATRLAAAADTLSIAVMEIVDNAIMLVIPGAMDAGLGDSLFWGALVLSLAIAWVVAFPVNRWLIARGRGHAVVHGRSSDGPSLRWRGQRPPPPSLPVRAGCHRAFELLRLEHHNTAGDLAASHGGEAVVDLIQRVGAADQRVQLQAS